MYRLTSPSVTALAASSRQNRVIPSGSHGASTEFVNTYWGAQVGAGQQVDLFDPPVPKQPSQGCVDDDSLDARVDRRPPSRGLFGPYLRFLALCLAMSSQAQQSLGSGNAGT